MTKCRAIVLIGLVLLLVIGCRKEPIIKSLPLQLVASYPVNADESIELSGLVIVKGQLYTVADKINSTIYRIDIEGNEARAYPTRTFQPPAFGSMDWEGITADNRGNFYLASETYSRVALLAEKSDRAVWMTPDLSREVDPSKGLFSKVNAGLEGIAWLGDGHLLLTVEREPRGLVEYRKIGDETYIKGYRASITRFGNELSFLRLPDFAGLTEDKGNLWALFRNAHLIVRLEKTDKGYRESSVAYSYAHVENDFLYQYVDTRFGHGEGLAMDENYFYVVTDNNRVGRKNNPTDKRPQLFVFKKPNLK